MEWEREPRFGIVCPQFAFCRKVFSRALRIGFVSVRQVGTSSRVCVGAGELIDDEPRVSGAWRVTSWGDREILPVSGA